MPSFEEMGRALDRELERLREAAETKVKPAARRKAAKALRTISARLARLARDIDSRARAKKTS